MKFKMHDPWGVKYRILRLYNLYKYYNYYHCFISSAKKNKTNFLQIVYLVASNVPQFSPPNRSTPPITNSPRFTPIPAGTQRTIPNCFTLELSLSPWPAPFCPNPVRFLPREAQVSQPPLSFVSNPDRITRPVACCRSRDVYSRRTNIHQHTRTYAHVHAKRGCI